MTIDELKAAHWTPRQLYDKTRVLETRDAMQEPLTLKALDTYPFSLNGQNVSFASSFVRCAIDHLVLTYKRKECLDNVERWTLAHAIVKEFGHWSFPEIKTFEYYLKNNRLPTYFDGHEVTAIFAIDHSNVMEKMRVYDKKRPEQTKEGEINEAKKMDELRLEKIFKDRKSPYNCYGDWQRTHDPEGREMPAGWDFEQCWNDWFNGHYEIVPTNYRPPLSLADQIWERCTANIPRNQSAYEYWKGIPSSEEVAETVDRILDRLRQSTLGFDVNTLALT